MESGAKGKRATKRPRQPLNKGEKGATSSDGSSAGASSIPVLNASSPPIHGPSAIHAPSSSALSSITSRNLNDLPPDQGAGSHMATAGGMFTNASNFTVHHPFFVDQSRIIHYHQYTADASVAMKHLFDYILPGAAHDSSARNPPPRCHPGTRITINNRIVRWFYSTEKKEWLLWINGLAGVGKSAIVQTLAENLALAKHLGASVFISRPRKCNDSQRIFLTIAYQLAQHIEAYYIFITTKLARDPGLVNKGMKEQFQTFIVEPFVEKKIGADGYSWAILVDGLDELDTRQGQQEIIRLVTTFVLEHPHLPLIWVIASRPEPHISTIFKQEKIVSSYTEEKIPIDSNEAHRDVERYLNSSFETIRNEFPQIVPQEDWPSRWDIWRLAHAASGLFAFAEFAIRFIGDMDYANPVTRLKNVLLALNHAKPGPSEDWPFAYLDALYTRILESIPPKVWLTTKRLFSALLHHQVSDYRMLKKPALWCIAMILDLEFGTIHASLNNCSSVLKILLRKDASETSVTFYHASFSDYLLDSARSGCFHISKKDADEEVYSSIIRIWQQFQAQFPPGLDSEYEDRWCRFSTEYVSKFTSKHLPDTNQLLPISGVLDHLLVEKHTERRGCTDFMFIWSRSSIYATGGMLTDRDQRFDLLRQLDSSTVCQAWPDHIAKLVNWVYKIWMESREELASRGVMCEVPFEHLRLDHLDWPTLYPRQTYVKQDYAHRRFPKELCSREKDISGIKDFQQRCPRLPVLVCGCPGKRFALLKDPEPSNGMEDLNTLTFYEGVSRYYIIPYPDPQNVQQFLRAKFDTIRANFTQNIPVHWPTEADFWKLADAASGRYAFAAMAIRFIEDRNHANPISRLEQILSIVDGHKGIPYGDETSHLDALYTHVLRSIPSTEWPIMKRVLGALLYIERSSFRQYSISFQVVCEILSLDQDMVYALFDNYSFATVLPERKSTEYETVIFYHASFVDYLSDPARSKGFYISVKSARADVLWSILGEKSPSSRGNDRLPIFSASYTPNLSKYIPDAFLDLLITNHDPGRPGGPFVSQEDRNRCFEMLGQLNAAIVCAGVFQARHVRILFIWVFDIWRMFRDELIKRRIIREVEFTQLRFDHLDHPDRKVHQKLVACTRSPGQVGYHLWVRMQLLQATGNPDLPYYQNVTYTKDGGMPRRLLTDVSDLESFRQSCPQLPVLICGSPGNRFALFEYQYTAADLTTLSEYSRPTSGLYIIPYPDEM